MTRGQRGSATYVMRGQRGWGEGAGKTGDERREGVERHK